MIFRYNIDMRVLQAATRTSHTEMYSRGRRGAPAKGVGRVYRRESSNLSISANRKALLRQCFFIGEKGRIWTRAPARGSEPSAACGGGSEGERVSK